LREGDDPLTLRLGPPSDGGNLADYDYAEDGAKLSTSIVSLGPGTVGVTRHEGGARDTSEMDGLVLEHIVRAPDGMQPYDLDGFALSELDAVKRPEESLVLTSHTGTLDANGVKRLIHDVHPG